MKHYIIVLVLALTVVACGEDTIRPKDSGDMANMDGINMDDVNAAERSGARVGAIGDGYGGAGTALPVSYDKNAIFDSNSVLAGRTVYFEFDSSDVSADYVELVKHHGKYLALNADVSMRLEGHTDEQGTREYNVALADRRAQAVKQLLMFEGASSSQVTIISYGEEKPAVFGHDESAWRMNRRAELVY